MNLGNTDPMIPKIVQWDWTTMSKTMNDQYFINSYDKYYWDVNLTEATIQLAS